MAYVLKDGFWRDSITGDILSSPPPPVQVGEGLILDPSQITPVSGSVYALNKSMTWASAKTAAPAASAIQIDTGPLPAGGYDFDIQMVAADTVAVGKGLVIEHRNAANAATLFNLGGVVAGQSGQVRLRNYVLALNERVRVIAGTAAGAASSMYVSAIGRRLA